MQTAGALARQSIVFIKTITWPGTAIACDSRRNPFFDSIRTIF
jgi:hypothetical protein